MELELRIVNRIARGLDRYKGSIRCIGSGPTSDYEVQLCGRNDDVVGEGVLRGHPRWAERLTGLLARCIAVAEPEHTLPIGEWRVATLIVRRRGRFLMEMHATSGDALESTFDSRPIPVKPVWQLMRWRLADDAWSQSDPPRMPEPIRLAVYRDGTTSYCRVSDLPPEARGRFDEWSIGRLAPPVPHVDDVAFPDDIDAYFGRGTALAPDGRAVY